MRQIERDIERCEAAAEAGLDARASDALAGSLWASYAKEPHLREALRRASAGRWADAADALRAHRDRLDHELAVAEAAAGAVSVSAMASSEARAHASAYAEAVAGLESLAALTDDDRVELEGLLQDVRASKDETMLGHAVKKLVDVAIEKGVETLPWVLPVVVEMAAKLTGMP